MWAAGRGQDGWLRMWAGGRKGGRLGRRSLYSAACCRWACLSWSAELSCATLHGRSSASLGRRWKRGEEGRQNAVNRKDRREGIEGPPNASLPNALAASPFVPIASSPPYRLPIPSSPPYPLQVASSSHPHPLLIVSPSLLISFPLPLLPRLGRPPRPHVTHSSLAGLA